MKSKEMKISACIITYNHENFIEKCLEGALAQKLEYDYEIVIGDDCSTDRTSDICKRYANLYPDKIRYLNRKKNLGVNRNWSQSIRDCQGDYIALCEGDDYWTDPSKLQKQVDFLRDNSEFALCCHNAKIIDDSGEILQKKKLFTLTNDKVYSQKELKEGAFLLTLSLVFANVVKEFPDEFYKVLNADKFLISILGNYGKGKYFDDMSAGAYRKHTGGVWSSLDKEKQFFNLYRTNEYLIKYYKKQKDPIYKYFKDKQIDNSRILFRGVNKKTSFVKLFLYNLYYLKYNKILISNFRMKEYIKHNIFFFSEKIKILFYKYN